jgi:DNA-binding transcriptional LysR family regulator
MMSHQIKGGILMADIDWNDLSYCLAVIREGSVTAAAQKMGVNHTTVSRRISALEKQLQAKLFDRSTTGWLVTPIGESIIGNMEQMEDNAQAVMRAVNADSTELSGHLRVTALDVCMQRIILPHLHAFSEMYPDITLDLLSTDDVLDLSSRAADIAFRTTNDPAPDVVGKKICDFAYALYAREDLYQRVIDGDNSVAAIGWVMPNVLDMPEWLLKNYPGMTVKYRANSLSVVLELVLQGCGITMLPCGLGDLEPTLARIPGTINHEPAGFWLLTHTDLRTTARIRLFRDYFLEKIQPRIPLLEGEWPEAYKLPEFAAERLSQNW